MKIICILGPVTRIFYDSSGPLLTRFFCYHVTARRALITKLIIFTNSREVQIIFNFAFCTADLNRLRTIIKLARLTVSFS